MAGSYRHITDSDNEFRGIDLIDNLGDAYEALEECWEMIKILAGNDKRKIFEAQEEYVRLFNPDYADKMTYDRFWE